MTFTLTLEKVLAYNKQLQPGYRRCKLISRICSGLYISDIDIAKTVSYLTTRKICAVVSVCTDHISPLILKQYEENKIEHLHISVYDSSDSKLSEYLDIGYKFICKHIRKGSVLIHCVMGISRSPTMTIYFLTRYFYERDPYIDTFIKTSDKSVVEVVYTYVIAHRSCISPIMTFINLLKNKEVELRKDRNEIMEWYSAKSNLKPE